MNNPNPFVPKGSLLEKQGQRRSHLKIAVSCVLAVSIVSLVAMLIQGCKREQPPADPSADTNPPMLADTNTPTVDTNPIVVPPPMPTNPPAAMIPAPVVEPPVVAAPVGDYAVAKGDTLGNIAKAHHVSLKDLEAANPGVDSKHLKIGQKLVIPASSSTTAAPAGATMMADAGGDVYTVKSGDTLTIIAKKHGTTVKALQAANSLTTTKIKVGQKLKLPAKAETAPAPVPAPMAAEPMPAPAPVPSPMTMPAPAPAQGK